MNAPEPLKLVDGVYQLQVGPNMVNAGFVVTGDGVVVIDSGPSPKAGEPIAYVINTHFHSSHTFGNQAFQVPVIGHSLCRSQMLRASEEEWHPREVARWRKVIEAAGVKLE